MASRVEGLGVRVYREPSWTRVAYRVYSAVYGVRVYRFRTRAHTLDPKPKP